jgi:hypothetical protein
MQSVQSHHHAALPLPDSRSCARDGCDGIVLRHSLGCAQSVYRCTRCFRTYDRPQPGTRTTIGARVSQAWNEFRTWREDRG